MGIQKSANDLEFFLEIQNLQYLGKVNIGEPRETKFRPRIQQPSRLPLCWQIPTDVF